MLLFHIINSALGNDGYTLFPSNAKNAEVCGISQDSRKISPGYIFASVKGLKSDGADYIRQAAESGAVAVLTELDDGACNDIARVIPVIKVKNVRRALALIALEIYFDGIIPTDLIGITGTNGKTSVAFYTSHILNTCGISAAALGTLGGVSPAGNVNTDRTTPDAVTLCDILKGYADFGVKTVAMEVSSHALALDRTYGLHFSVGVFTNLTEDHLDFHKSMDEYLAEKKKLFLQCDTAVLNSDDSAYQSIIRDIPCKKVTYSSVTANADYYALQKEHLPTGSCFAVFHKGESHKIRLSTPGDFSVMNALAAIAACCEYGIPFEDACKAIALAPPVPGRFEYMGEVNGAAVILDYAHTPDGIKNVLSTAREFTKNKLIALFGCGGDRDRQKRSIMGAITTQMADYTVITSDNPRNENELAIVSDIISGLDPQKAVYNIIIDREAAITNAILSAKDGDTVLIMGKGHEAYQQIGSIRYPLSDRSIIINVIRKNKNGID